MLFEITFIQLWTELDLEQSNDKIESERHKNEVGRQRSNSPPSLASISPAFFFLLFRTKRSNLVDCVCVCVLVRSTGTRYTNSFASRYRCPIVALYFTLGLQRIASTPRPDARDTSFILFFTTSTILLDKVLQFSLYSWFVQRKLGNSCLSLNNGVGAWSKIFRSIRAG